MRTLIPVSVGRMLSMAAVLFLFFCVSPLAAQEEENSGGVFYVMDFMKSNPAVDYVAFEEELWKPVHQERVRRGQIAYWFVTEVAYPNGASAEYDYVTVSVITDPTKLGDPFPNAGEVIEAAHPDVNWETFNARTEEARTWVKSEIYYVANRTLPLEEEADAEEDEEDEEDDGSDGWGRVNFMRVSEANMETYERMEDEVFKPIHQAMTAAGLLDGWMMLGRVMPRGADLPYQYITVDFVDEWGNMFAPQPDNLWETVHPGKDPEKLWQKMANIRTLARSEMWRGVLNVDD